MSLFIIVSDSLKKLKNYFYSIFHNFLQQISLYNEYFMNYLTYREPYIRFKRDPAHISAIFAYMGPQIYEPLWQLSNGRYIHWGLRQQVKASNVLSIEAESLRLQQNGFDMIPQITELHFPNLRALCLQNNNITSLEALRQINLTKLGTLQLKNNHLINTKSLKKAHLPALQAIDLRQNRIASLDGFPQCQFPALKEIVLETAKQHTIQDHKLSTLVKIQSQNIEWMFAVGRDRIISDQIKIVFLMKWNQCQLKTAEEGRRYGNQVRNLIVW